MDKNWLIRTKDLKIKGPVSREKLLELLETESLDPKDELCSGNGYWFFVKEEELLERYVRKGEKQSFNPVSDLPDCIIPVVESAEEDREEAPFSGIVPEDEDLEYPQEAGPAPRKQRNDIYLFVLLGILLCFLACVVYYYLQVLNKDLPFLSSAHAQTQEIVKKKIFTSCPRL